MGWIMAVFLGICFGPLSRYTSESSYNYGCVQGILLPPLTRNVQPFLLSVRILGAR